MLRHRLLSGIAIIAVVAAVYIYAPLEWIGLLLLLFTFFSLRETCGLFAAAGFAPHCATAVVCGSLSFAAAWFWMCGLLPGWLAAGVPMAALLGLFTAGLRAVPTPEGLRRILATVATQCYAPLLMVFFALLLAGLGEDGRLLTVFFAAVVKATDTGAYFTGCAIGRTKLIPHISPAKTWEGSVGGILLAYAVAAAFYFPLGGVIGPFRMTLADLLVLPLLLAVAGSAGDLVESMIKRAAGRKDSGTLIAGMGGILDVLDSLLFAAPVFYLYVAARMSVWSAAGV